MSIKGAYKLKFTRDTLRQLEEIIERKPLITKEDACRELDITVGTINKAADRAGLRKELTDLFPPRMPKAKLVKSKKTENRSGVLPIDWNCPHIKAATMSWRKAG